MSTDPTATDILPLIVAIAAEADGARFKFLCSRTADLCRVVIGLEKQIDGWTKLPDREDEIAGWKAENARLVGEVAGLRVALGNTDSQADREITRREEAERAHRAACEEIVELRASCTTLTDERNSALAKLAEAESKLGAARFHAESCERTNKVIDDDRTKHAARVIELGEKLNTEAMRGRALSESVVDLTTRAEKVERENATLTAQVAALEAERSTAIACEVSRARADERGAWVAATEMTSPAAAKDRIEALIRDIESGLKVRHRLRQEIDALSRKPPPLVGPDRAEELADALHLTYDAMADGPFAPARARRTEAMRRALSSLSSLAPVAPTMLTVEALAAAFSSASVQKADGSDHDTALLWTDRMAAAVFSHLTASGPVAIPQPVAAVSDEGICAACRKPVRMFAAPARTVTVEQLTITRDLTPFVGATIIASPPPPAKEPPPIEPVVPVVPALVWRADSRGGVSSGGIGSPGIGAYTTMGGGWGVSMNGQADSMNGQADSEPAARRIVEAIRARLSTPAATPRAEEGPVAIDGDGAEEALMMCSYRVARAVDRERAEKSSAAYAALVTERKREQCALAKVLAHLAPGPVVEGPVWSDFDADGWQWASMGKLRLGVQRRIPAPEGRPSDGQMPRGVLVADSPFGSIYPSHDFFKGVRIAESFWSREAECRDYAVRMATEINGATLTSATPAKPAPGVDAERERLRESVIEAAREWRKPNPGASVTPVLANLIRSVDAYDAHLTGKPTPAATGEPRFRYVTADEAALLPPSTRFAPGVGREAAEMTNRGEFRGETWAWGTIGEFAPPGPGMVDTAATPQAPGETDPPDPFGYLAVFGDDAAWCPNSPGGRADLAHHIRNGGAKGYECRRGAEVAVDVERAEVVTVKPAAKS